MQPFISEMHVSETWLRKQEKMANMIFQKTHIQPVITVDNAC